jgi:two-component system, OmpR family, phosphate regulon sensor histidine kinase PhoR
MKFSENNAHIFIRASIEYKAPTKAYLILEIEDNGIGIDEEEQKHVFEPFFKSKSRKSMAMNPKGLGLGLHISQSIASQYNASLRMIEKCT